MGRTTWIGSGAAMLAAAALVAPAAHANGSSAYSSVYSSPPLVVQPAPVRTWVPGHWEHSHFGPVWVEGHWIVTPAGQFVQVPIHPHHGFRGARADQDRDGIPNRFDRDVDGDGVPNWRDRAPRNARLR